LQEFHRQVKVSSAEAEEAEAEAEAAEELAGWEVLEEVLDRAGVVSLESSLLLVLLSLLAEPEDWASACVDDIL
jgi:hypothetical protein